MALWFTHLCCQRLLGHGGPRRSHADNRFLSPERARSRKTINIADYRAALEAEREAG
jgi:hypothetical protein